MRRSMKNMAWLDKLMVSISRKRGKVPLCHQPLKQQLAHNRGKALGLPKFRPKTRYQERIGEARTQRQMRTFGVPF
jgi:hypothetical protein